MKINRKKSILYGVAVIAIAAVAAWNISLSSNSNSQKVTNFKLANIEALSSGEGGGGANLTCYCALLSDQNCAVNNNGSSVCAGGENIECWKYNRNCN